MNSFFRWLAAILIVTAVISTLGIVKYTKIMAAMAYGESFPEPSAAVNTMVTEISEQKEQIRVTGQIVAKQSLMLATELPGKVSRVGFLPGARVTENQVLLEQDTSQEQAQLAGAAARMELARKTLSRYKNLLAENRISQNQVDEAAMNLRVADAEVKNLTASINKKTIIAPFAGTVGLEKIEVGELLPSGASITYLVGIDASIWIDFQLPQTQKQLLVGDDVSIKTISDTSSTTVLAKVIAKNSLFNENSRHISYRAELDNTDGRFSHNQIVSVVVPLGTEHAVLVPNSSVTRNHHGEFIYLLQLDDQQQYRAKPVRVTLGQRKGDYQLVTAGLSGGEFIATQGAFKLREGLLVYPNTQGVSQGEQ